MWRNLSNMRTERYPNTLKAACSMSNLACILMEFFAEQLSASVEAMILWKNAANIALEFYSSMTGIKINFPKAQSAEAIMKENNFLPTIDSKTNQTKPESDGKSSDKQVEVEVEVSVGDSMEQPPRTLPVNTAPLVLQMLLHFQRCLRVIQNDYELEISQFMLEHIEEISQLLTEKEFNKLNLERVYEGMPTFVYGDIKTELRLILEDRNLVREEVLKTSLKAIVEGQDEDAESSLAPEGGPKTIGMSVLTGEDYDEEDDDLTLRSRRNKGKSKRDKKNEKSKRAEVVLERRRLYNMIISDEISTLFGSMAAKEESVLPEMPPEDNDVKSKVTKPIKPSMSVL